MTSQSNYRFDFKPDCLFSGQLIKRKEPISFRLNAREFKAFRGDTILSALLAAGIDSAGQLHDEPIALDPGLSLSVFPAAHGNDPHFALPMDRTKVIAGMELVTPAHNLISSTIHKSRLAGFVTSLQGKARHNLDYDLGARAALAGPWINMLASERQTVDLVVVGGGVAGMSAALSAAKEGLRVALIEQRAVLGGDAQFFGAAEGEKRSEDFVKDLIERIDERGGVQVFTNSVALWLADGAVRVHQAHEKDGFAATRLIEFDTRKTIIAAGMFERLPIFPGNRLPGISGSRTAFHLAAHYGVWRGQAAAFCTVSSAATRVALLAADLGIKIARLADGRPNPKSRFFDFAKAYGVLLSTGTRVNHVNINAHGDLNVTLGLSRDVSARSTDRIKVDRLVVCGGWQPDLTLWHMAGGRLKWDRHGQQLRSHGKLENVELAGACAGVSGMTQCARSGAGAFFTLFGLPDDPKAINNSELAQHESADGALPVSGPDPDLANTYLDAGFSFAMAQQKPKAGFLDKLVPGPRGKPGIFDVSEEALSLNDVVAKVALKEIDAELAEVIAQERCGLTSTLERFEDEWTRLSASKTQPYKDLEPGFGPTKTQEVLAPETSSGPRVFISEKQPDTEPPAYLHGRFGNRARTVSLFSDQIDNLEVGSLIYSDTKETVPGKAVGVIFALLDSMEGQALALVDLSRLADPHRAILRNDTHTIEIELKHHAFR